MIIVSVVRYCINVKFPISSIFLFVLDDNTIASIKLIVKSLEWTGQGSSYKESVFFDLFQKVYI